jgi:predicted metal-dependent HD superfamily phosphohydrolase
MTDREQWFETWGLLDAPPPEKLFQERCPVLGAAPFLSHVATYARMLLSTCAGFSSREAPCRSSACAVVSTTPLRHHMDDNEEQSAYWAEKSLIAEGLESDVAVAIGSLVLATKHTAVSDTDDAKLLVDIDLSIPGAAEARFIEYERQIRQEYDWVAGDAFRQRRTDILAALLNRFAIYSTGFASRLEEQARKNLTRSLMNY